MTVAPLAPSLASALASASLSFTARERERERERKRGLSFKCFSFIKRGQAYFLFFLFNCVAAGQSFLVASNIIPNMNSIS